MTNREFIETVAAMRAVQRRRSAGQKDHDTLAEARRLERQVDETLDRIGSHERQGVLFDVGRRGRNIGRVEAMIAVANEEAMRRAADADRGGGS